MQCAMLITTREVDWFSHTQELAAFGILCRSCLPFNCGQPDAWLWSPVSSSNAWLTNLWTRHYSCLEGKRSWQWHYLTAAQTLNIGDVSMRS